MLGDHPEATIGLLTLAIGAITIINSLVNSVIQRRLARRERTVQLYDGFYSAANYRRVVAPVYRLMIKWRGLPSPDRERYRAAVRLGWTGVDDPAALVATYVSPEKLGEDPAKAHFRDTLANDAFTEHEALTTFLYFWAKCDQLLTAKLVDRALFRRLFAGPFDYYRDFLADLRADVTPHFAPGAAPPWVGASERIEAMMA